MREEIRDTEDSGPHSKPHTVRLVLVGVLLAVVVAVAVDNRQDAKVGFLFGDVRAPLIVVVLCATVLGVAIGWLLSRRSRRG